MEGLITFSGLRYKGMPITPYSSIHDTSRRTPMRTRPRCSTASCDLSVSRGPSSNSRSASSSKHWPKGLSRAQPGADARQDPVAQRRRPSACARASGRSPACAPSIGCASRNARDVVVVAALRAGPPAPRPGAAGSSASRPWRASRSSGRGPVANAASRVARFASSTLTYDEKSCIGTSSLQRQLDGAGGERRPLDARQRVQIAALGGGIGLDLCARAQVLEAGVVGAARRRGDDDVQQVGVDGAPAARSAAGAGVSGLGDRVRSPRQQDQRAQQHRAPQLGSRRPRSRPGVQPSFAARAPYSSVTRAPNAARSSSARKRCSIRPSRPTTSSSTTWSSSPRRLSTRSKNRSIGARSARTSAHWSEISAIRSAGRSSPDRGQQARQRRVVVGGPVEAARVGVADAPGHQALGLERHRAPTPRAAARAAP